jgi:3-oxoacyl-[acyl-carrier-protein] synthase-1
VPSSSDDPELPSVASVPVGRPGRPLADRVLELGLLPVREALGGARLLRRDLESLGLFLCCPGPRGSRTGGAGATELGRAFLARAGLGQARLEGTWDGGHASVLAAVGAAAERLRTGALRAALVVGADSYLDAASMARLDQAWRLKSERNVDGFIPGEAGVALVLESAAGARSRGVEPLARVAAFGEGREPEAVGSERRATGRGLAAALSTALAGAGDGDFVTICDLNGESHRAVEWGTALVLLGARLARQRVLWHPAQSVGDVGAASGGLGIALACRTFARRSPPAARALVWCAGDGGERAACLLEAPV